MRKSVLLLASMGLALLLAGGAAWAAAGDLDPTFGGGDGQVVSTEPCFVCHVEHIEVLPDSGKILAAGEYGGPVVRYNPDGSPDDTFGGDGLADPGPVALQAFVVQPDGGIIAGGQMRNAQNPDPEFALVRFLPDGTLDTAFGGGDGKVKTVFGVGDAVARDVVAQEDGKLLVVGSQNKFAKGWRGVNFALARYKPDGTLDASFGGGDGKITTDLSPGTEDYAAAVDIDEDGKAVVGGAAVAYNSANDQYNNVFGLARYLLE